MSRQKPHLRSITITIFLVAICKLADAQGPVPLSLLEQRVENLLSRMTPDEKIDYIGGFENFYIRPIQRLGLPKIRLADGPLGVRNYGKATAFPAPILFAATWNPKIANMFGTTVGRECRAKGVHVLLAPGVNIHRSPLCARNFEYWGEDPLLGSRMVVPYIQGVQSQGVVATVKHYAGNNQEYARTTVSSDIDERTLQEIYLPIFHAAVTEAHVGAVMTAYNLLNGVYCSENDHLIRDILKGQWGFDGVVISDWGATHDGVKSALAGLDLEMPAGDFMNHETLLPALESGKLSQSMIDDKVRRILRMIVRNNFMDRPQQDNSISLASPESRQIALAAAREGIVLLKNQDQMLPFDQTKIHTIAVIGPGSHPAITGGGGSSAVIPFRATSVLDGMISQAASDTRVLYDPGLDASLALPETPCADIVMPKAFHGEYFNGRYLEGQPVLVRDDVTINFSWTKAPAPEVPAKFFSVRWTGTIRAKVTGKYDLIVRGDDDFHLFLNNTLVTSSSEDEITTRVATVSLQADRDYRLRLEYHQYRGDAVIAFAVTRRRVALRPIAIELAKHADVAVVCVGFDAATESEGEDRTFELPPGQVELIESVAKVNPRTVVILTAGGNVAMEGWLDRVGGLLHTWYPGQEGGTAIAEILYGKVNPSGKLPVSFERRWEDNPSFPNYYDQDGDKRVAYKEGMLVGYRYYDSKNVVPRFPFGFGLSYSTFDVADLRFSPRTLGANDKLAVTCTVTNTGNMRGSEVVQLYVGLEKPNQSDPLKELKGFRRVTLDPGETILATFEIDRALLAHFDASKNRWFTAPGIYRLYLGASSRDIRIQDTFVVTPASE